MLDNPWVIFFALYLGVLFLGLVIFNHTPDVQPMEDDDDYHDRLGN